MSRSTLSPAQVPALRLSPVLVVVTVRPTSLAAFLDAFKQAQQMHAAQGLSA